MFLVISAMPGFVTPSGFAETAITTPSGLKILDSQEVDLGSHSIIYNRVETPRRKPQPPISEQAVANVAEYAPTSVSPIIHMFHGPPNPRMQADPRYVNYCPVPFQSFSIAPSISTAQVPIQA